MSILLLSLITTPALRDVSEIHLALGFIYLMVQTVCAFRLSERVVSRASVTRCELKSFFVVIVT